ncbi:PAQR family membrane homeostasis protein TrhA [Acetonema longum]|uniref:Hemolysin III-like protein n=1 Tax=Acetonema longum DSM 6540 TaxID=1009370 RepID=F7NHY1_9FIRM|nr:hemolysin III family protein [Acetonema longum]EGO64360.1 Hemolysin III-like protein [Acetonema longum DSM 6540]
MEERWNAITHGAGASLALAGLVVLIVFSCLYGGIWHRVSFSIYGVSLVLLYLASTLYHSFTNEKLKKIFQTIDHAAIYLLIAGTYTPFMLVPLHGPLGWTVFGLMWGVALLGIVFQIFWGKRFKLLSTLGYLLMGWFIVVCIKPLIAALPVTGLWWLVAGGLFYTVGSLFYIRRWFPYHHAVWHLFVLAGSAAHYISIIGYVLPIPVG